jgi:hypothetical protein
VVPSLGLPVKEKVSALRRMRPVEAEAKAGTNALWTLREPLPAIVGATK